MLLLAIVIAGGGFAIENTDLNQCGTQHGNH